MQLQLQFHFFCFSLLLTQPTKSSHLLSSCKLIAVHSILFIIQTTPSKKKILCQEEYLPCERDTTHTGDSSSHRRKTPSLTLADIASLSLSLLLSLPLFVIIIIMMMLICFTLKKEDHNNSLSFI